MSERKRLGFCTKCDEPIFEFMAKYTEGPRAGEPRQIGMPLPGVRRLTIVRASGHLSNWSVCKTCQVGAEDMVELNKREVLAMAMERSEATSPASFARRDTMLKLFAFDIPLGVLKDTPWSEVR